MKITKSILPLLRGWHALLLIAVLIGLADHGPGAENQGQANIVGRPKLDRMQRRELLATSENRKRELPPGRLPEALVPVATLGPTANAATPVGTAIGQWFSLGPGPIQSSQNSIMEQVSGRVAAVAVDPFENSHWLIGAAQGGIWGTTDMGVTWSPLTDDQPSLAMGAIAFAPGNAAVVYAGTGEANFSADSYAGRGLLVSHDNGSTWLMINTNFSESSFSSIVVDRLTNTNHLVVATTRGVGGLVNHGTNIPPNAPSRGVFFSVNGGLSFTQVLNGEATDLKNDPIHFNNQYAGLGEIFGAPTNGVYRTTNGWTTSERIAGPWYAATDQTNFGRVALAISPSNPNVAYVAIAYTRGNINGDLVGIWQTQNAWDAAPSWVQLAGIDNGPYLWYSFALSVDPVNPDILYYAGIDLLEHSFPADTWFTLTSNIHPDQHALAWMPYGFDLSTHALLLGNDGGVWFNGNYPPTQNWVGKNNGISTALMYKGAVNPDHGSSLSLAGLQDNGTVDNQGAAIWPAFFGGDGCDCAIDSRNPSSNWAFCWETINGEINLLRTLDGGNLDIQNASFGIDSTYAPFFVHFEKSPTADDLFIAGTAQLWRCTNFFTGAVPTWVSNSPVYFDAQGNPAIFTAMAFAPSDKSGMIYAFGTGDGQFLITTNGGTTWRNLNSASGLPLRYVSGIAFSPADSNSVYVCYSGFNASTPGSPGHLFKSTNALALTPAWVDVSPPVDLPNNCLAINPLGPQNLFVGTDVGVWFSGDAGAHWSHYGPSSGMPNVAVFDLRMDDVGEPTAFTHGRGAFTLKPNFPIINILYAKGNPVVPIGCLTCPPDSWANPGDLVDFGVTLQNTLPINTVDLVGSLAPSSFYRGVSGPQSYGSLQGLGASVTRNFSFVLNGGAAGALVRAATYNCGDRGHLLINLTDQGVNLGQVDFPFRVGVPNFPLGQDFSNVPAGAQLPRGWSTSWNGRGLPWRVGTNSPPNEPPRDAPDSPQDQPGNSGPPEHNAFTPSVPGIAQSYLVSPVFTPLTASAVLYFRQAFSVSNGFDGCILEISINPTVGFQEILSAGGSFVQNGYNQILNGNNPLGPRPAWSGDSGGWLPVSVNLPPSALGQQVQLRWNLTSSRGRPGGGYFLDAVSVSEARCLPPVTNPVILNPRLQASNFVFDVLTVPQRTYYVEFKTNLTDQVWQPLTTLTGDGTRQSVSNLVVGASQTYYRFHVN